MTRGRSELQADGATDNRARPEAVETRSCDRSVRFVLPRRLTRLRTVAQHPDVRGSCAAPASMRCARRQPSSAVPAGSRSSIGARPCGSGTVCPPPFRASTVARPLLARCARSARLAPCTFPELLDEATMIRVVRTPRPVLGQNPGRIRGAHDVSSFGTPESGSPGSPTGCPSCRPTGTTPRVASGSGERPMAAVQLADDRAGLDVERGEQRDRAVAAIVEGASLGLGRLHRQQRRGALEGLNLRLLRQLDGFGPVRLQPRRRARSDRWSRSSGRELGPWPGCSSA